MNLDDTARVRRPDDPVEYRLGTVTDIKYTPHSSHIERLRLRFPTGEERTYQADEVAACSRADDRAAIVAALTGAGRSLREACRIAHDYDEYLSTAIIALLLALYDTARTGLGLRLDPASLEDPAANDDSEAGQP
jgi:hypothetical protein